MGTFNSCDTGPKSIHSPRQRAEFGRETGRRVVKGRRRECALADPRSGVRPLCPLPIPLPIGVRPRCRSGGVRPRCRSGVRARGQTPLPRCPRCRSGSDPGSPDRPRIGQPRIGLTPGWTRAKARVGRRTGSSTLSLGAHAVPASPVWRAEPFEWSTEIRRDGESARESMLSISLALTPESVCGFGARKRGSWVTRRRSCGRSSWRDKERHRRF